MLKSDPLWYLIQISKVNSMSSAAEFLHISQPSLTVAIKKLEEQLNVQLLERHYNGVSLTADGEQVVALAEQAFALFDQIESISTSRPERKETPFPDDIIIYANPALMQLLFNSFATHSSVLTQFIKINSIDSNFSLHLIEQNANTFVFCIPEAKQIERENIATHQFNIGTCNIQCTVDFPYFKPTQKNVSLRELIDVPLIEVEHPLYFYTSLKNRLKKYGEPNIYATVPNNTICRSMVSRGLGYCFTSTMFQSDPNSSDNLRTLSIRNAPKFTCAMLYNKNCDSEIVNAIIDTVKHNFLQPISQ